MRLFDTLLCAAAIFTASTPAFAQNQQPATDSAVILHDRHLTGFETMRIQGPFDVYVIQGTEEYVKLDGPADLLEEVITEVNGGELNIRNLHDFWPWGDHNEWWGNNNRWHNRKRVAVYIAVKTVDAITVSGSGHMFFTNSITSGTLKLELHGSGLIEGKISATTVESHISGSGRITLSGKAENSTVRISGSGRFSGRDLLTATSSVHVSGSGHADVNASDKLNAVVRGSARIGYTGSPNVNFSKSGSGAVSRL